MKKPLSGKGRQKKVTPKTPISKRRPDAAALRSAIVPGLGDVAAVRQALAERSFGHFIRYAWSAADPAAFVGGWHIDAIAEHLEAVTVGAIKRLIINVPPRHMKSTAVSVLWPAWVWGPRRQPGAQWLFASYAANLAIRDSVRCRRVLESPWYQSQWGDVVQLAGDQNTKSRFETKQGGARIATSVDGAATGEGGDIVVIDDPHNVRQGDSARVREATCRWFDEVMALRLNDPEAGAFVVIMQRVNEGDLTGHILSRDGDWEHLCLPAEYEPDHPFARPTSIGFCDPRTKPGALLWPARYSKVRLARMARQLGSHAAAGQLQQRPAPRDGGIVKMGWFQRYAATPDRQTIIRIVQSWDTANKAGSQNAYSVCGTWVETKRGSYLLDVLRSRLDLPDLLRIAKSHGLRWQPNALLIEDKASGTALIQHLMVETTLPVLPVTPRGDKATRMEAETPVIEAGRVWLPEMADWLAEYENEMRNFPNGAFADQVDMTSQYLHWSRENNQPLEFF